jgi:hypothetical protein
MRYGLSCFLLLGLAAPTFVTAAGKDTTANTSTNTTIPALSTPPTDLSGSETNSKVSGSETNSKNYSAPSTDVRPDLGLDPSDSTATTAMDDASETKEEKRVKKKKVRKVAKKHRKHKGKRHHARHHKSCGSMVNEAYKSQNSLFMNKESIPVGTPYEPVAVICDPVSSCAPTANVK